MPVEPREPWVSFLKALDGKLETPVALHCIGGFAMNMLYEISRNTSDIDFLVMGLDNAALLQERGGQGSALHRQFNVYVQPVGLATFPEDYSTRLVPLWEALGLKNIHLYGLEPHDLALTKLERNSEIDRQDVQALAAKGLIDPSVLESRYMAEFRPNLVAGVERHDLTLKLWLDMIRETQSGEGGGRRTDPSSA